MKLDTLYIFMCITNLIGISFAADLVLSYIEQGRGLHPVIGLVAIMMFLGSTYLGIRQLRAYYQFKQN